MSLIQKILKIQIHSLVNVHSKLTRRRSQCLLSVRRVSKCYCIVVCFYNVASQRKSTGSHADVVVHLATHPSEESNHGSSDGSFILVKNMHRNDCFVKIKFRIQRTSGSLLVCESFNTGSTYFVLVFLVKGTNLVLLTLVYVRPAVHQPLVESMCEVKHSAGRLCGQCYTFGARRNVTS
jgi:hypothetical protein